MTLKEIQDYILSHDKVDIVDGLGIAGFSGIVHYYPEELTLTIKAGTTVENIRNILHASGQDFDFYAKDTDTIGTVYAKGGHNVRMSVLGIEMVNGKAEHLKFGGEVIKNVAGYDVSRMLCGSRGECGVITQISFKVLPQNSLTHAHKDILMTNSSEYVHGIRKKIAKVFDPKGKFTSNSKFNDDR